jgi:hypothetical protein
LRRAERLGETFAIGVQLELAKTLLDVRFAPSFFLLSGKLSAPTFLVRPELVLDGALLRKLALLNEPSLSDRGVEIAPLLRRATLLGPQLGSQVHDTNAKAQRQPLGQKLRRGQRSPRRTRRCPQCCPATSKSVAARRRAESEASCRKVSKTPARMDSKSVS